jgi:hypothetical protein
VTPPKVLAASIQNGLSQRSFVDRLSIDFSEQVNLATLIANGAITSAVTLTNLGVNADADVDAPIVLSTGQFHQNFNAAAGQSRLTWSLNSGVGVSTSLPNGYYRLVLKASQSVDVDGTPIDGNANGTGGDATCSRSTPSRATPAAMPKSTPRT